MKTIKRMLGWLMAAALLATGIGMAEETVTAEQATTEQQTETAEETVSEKPLQIQIRPEDPAPGYILVQGEDFWGFLALPTEGVEWRPIRQQLEDGSEWVNMIRMTPDGFCVTEANCPGQDCVGEGEVTLENMQDRLLWNMVICLAHKLSLSLYTPDEAYALSSMILGQS